jgi:anaerobic selenocysteine-containing dehydrogenase
MTAAERRTVRTMCPINCHPTFCGMLATIEGDRVVEVRGDKDNPDSRGFLCVRGQATKEIIGNPKRLLYPLMSERRGSEEWRRASWDEALDRILSRMQAVGFDRVGVWPGHGAITNDYGVFANAFMMLRFANMAGCQWWDPSMICWGLGAFGAGLTGALEINTKEDMGENADLIVMWGANIANQPNTGRHIAEAKRRGAGVVAVDVRVSEACRLADDYFIVKPGTDAALALAMMHVIIAEGLQDDAFIAAHTVGFEALREHVAEYTPEWAAGVTGVDAARIVGFARRYAGTARAMILLSGSSMYKDQHGWQASRAVSCLPPLTGKLGRPGTGFGPRHAGTAHGFALNDILDAGARKPGDWVPNQMSEIIEALEDGRVRVLLLSGTNFISSFPDAARVGRALEKLDLVVTHDLFMHETARRFADIVLPGTAWLEDIGCKATTTHLYLMDRALAPQGEARSLVDFMKALAERCGLEDFYPWHEDGGHIDAVLDTDATAHATVAGLRRQGGFAPLRISHVAHPDHRYATPSGRIEFYSERAAAQGLPALPSYQARPASNYPLELRTGRTLAHFHSFYDAGRALPSLAKLERAPTLLISRADAAARGVIDGAAITIRNERSRMEAIAEVTDAVLPGTVWMHDGCPGLNALTSGGPSLPDGAITLFPFSTGQSAFDARVEVEAR